MLEGIQKQVGPDVTVFYDRGLPTVTDLATRNAISRRKRRGQPGLKVETFENADLSGRRRLRSAVRNINDAGTNWESIDG